MTETMLRWMGDADALRHLADFGLAQGTLELGYIRTRASDYYVSLVGELFDELRRQGEPSRIELARLGNALAQFSSRDRDVIFGAFGIDAVEARLFAAAAFYFGGYVASAYVTAVGVPDVGLRHPVEGACFDILTRRNDFQSEVARGLLVSLRQGAMNEIATAVDAAKRSAEVALKAGPDEWIPAYLLQKLLEKFAAVNLRAILPDGESAFWDELVASFIDRNPSAWDFFPSQIAAIQSGLLDELRTFSLQMPTGAGKTALCETLLYRHTRTHPDSTAILLVPLRSLASELRHSLAIRLAAMGVPTRAVYGGTVPTGDEVTDLDSVRVMIATPEALTGILSAAPAFLQRISLLICDEGHLLASTGRGVSLELLLARLRARPDGGPKMVFVSAIVPNIEEVNAWLGGSDETVIRSDYRPATADFAVLAGGNDQVDLTMHPHEQVPVRYLIPGFLRRSDFQYQSAETGRRRTYPFTTTKTTAIAAGRKALQMGTVAVFAAVKAGAQGAIGLANELIEQTSLPFPLPMPRAFMDIHPVNIALDYLRREFGDDWSVTRTLRVGAVLHHGDVPQETREVLEDLLRRQAARFAICTSTLAEGVNLPIRTLVLYSVERRDREGTAKPLLARDIKNLVGRAGRAGVSSKGLVICANPRQWPYVQPVAEGRPGEPVHGALRDLVVLLRNHLIGRPPEALNNRLLESSPVLFSLVDGIDSTLIDLAAEEIGEEALVLLARRVADQSFASRQAREEPSRELLRNVFSLRARRIAGFAATGRLGWLKQTGARARLVDTVVDQLAPLRNDWAMIEDPVDAPMVLSFLSWAWNDRELQQAIRRQYGLEANASTAPLRDSFYALVAGWLRGDRYADLGAGDLDQVLRVHTHVISFVLQVLVEQAVALLQRHLESIGTVLADAVTKFPDHLRFGVPTLAARALSSSGVRHRRAAILLATYPEVEAVAQDRGTLLVAARRVVVEHAQALRDELGELVFENTLRDLR